MFANTSSRAFAIAVLAALAAGCSGVSQLSPSHTSATESSARAPMATRNARPFANQRASQIAVGRRPVSDVTGTFSRPANHGRATFNWLFASDLVTGNVDVYDESSGAQISQCAGCGGWGLAVNGTSLDLAIGTEVGTVTVWHVTASGLAQYATLNLSGGASGDAAYGLAFDAKGNLFAGNWPSNAIDEFAAATIAAGGGGPSSTFHPRAFGSVYFLATDGNKLFADGLDPTMNDDLVAKVGTKSGKAKVLQTITNSVGGYPGGIVFDAHHNLIVNNQYGTLTTFAKPWTGAATSSFDYSWPYANYTALALDAPQSTVWAANVFFQIVSGQSYAFTDAQANSYPLGSLGSATSPAYQDEEYDGIAVDPPAKN